MKMVDGEFLNNVPEAKAGNVLSSYTCNRTDERYAVIATYKQRYSQYVEVTNDTTFRKNGTFLKPSKWDDMVRSCEGEDVFHPNCRDAVYAHFANDNRLELILAVV